MSFNKVKNTKIVWIYRRVLWKRQQIFNSVLIFSPNNVFTEYNYTPFLNINTLIAMKYGYIMYVSFIILQFG